MKILRNIGVILKHPTYSDLKEKKNWILCDV